jgi:hypothetical protein
MSQDRAVAGCLGVIIMCILIVFGSAFHIITMQYGWGLTAQSWGWIIGNVIMQLFIYGAVSIIATLIKDN